MRWHFVPYSDFSLNMTAADPYSLSCLSSSSPSTVKVIISIQKYTLNLLLYISLTYRYIQHCSAMTGPLRSSRLKP